MTSTVAIAGSLPVLCTPFDDDLRIAEGDFEAAANWVVDAGSDGCVFPGVASEVETLSADERAELVRRLGATIDGRIPFIVGASDPEPDAVRARMLEGAQAGAAAAMVMAPAHLGADVGAQMSFFAAAARDAPIPILLQNAPKPIGAGLAPTLVAEIAAHPSIRFVKEETAPCGQNLTRLTAVAGDRIDGVFGGAGARHVVDELARGSRGAMPACEFADLHARLLSAWRKGERDEARRLYVASLPALVLQSVFRVRMTKATLAARGVIAATGSRAAGPEMDDHDRAELRRLLEDLEPDLALAPPR